MKKMLAVVLVLLMCCACSAEGMEEMLVTEFENYAQFFTGFTQEEWKADDIEQIQVILPEDGVTVSVCLSGEYVKCISVEFPCDQVMDSVRAAIEGLGWLSYDAIDQMLALEDDATLVVEDYTIYRVHGENRDAFSICRTEDIEEMVWQPIHGGSKLHREIECSGMDVSRMITDEAAQLTGWDECKRCMDDETETEAE